MPHVSDRRLYLDKDGNVVEEDDPNRQTLLVSKGGTLPMDDARRYGLLEQAAEKAAPEAEKGQETARAASETKGRSEEAPRPADEPKKKA